MQRWVRPILPVYRGCLRRPWPPGCQLAAFAPPPARHSQGRARSLTEAAGGFIEFGLCRISQPVSALAGAGESAACCPPPPRIRQIVPGRSCPVSPLAGVPITPGPCRSERTLRDRYNRSAADRLRPLRSESATVGHATAAPTAGLVGTPGSTRREAKEMVGGLEPEGTSACGDG